MTTLIDSAGTLPTLKTMVTPEKTAICGMAAADKSVTGRELLDALSCRVLRFFVYDGHVWTFKRIASSSYGAGRVMFRKRSLVDSWGRQRGRGKFTE